MKKIFITLCVVLVSLGASAQKGETAVGANISYGSERQNIGIGAKGQYNFTDNIRGEVSFDYFLKKEGRSMWDINANIHYLFDVAPQIKVYPLAGIGYVHFGSGSSNIGSDSSNDNDFWTDADDGDNGYPRAYNSNGSSSSNGEIAINIGGGAQYALTEKININAELKYQIISNFNVSST
ncbi:MAG: porin family protein [Prevotella sp.]|nr:porin family protein [Prevotella sp.]